MADVAPAPVRSFDAFPTPAEIAGQRMRYGTAEWLEERCGCSPWDPDAWLELCRKRPLYAVRHALLAMANQREILDGVPLRWEDSAIREMTPDDLGAYADAIRRSAGAASEGEASSGDNGRPTPAATRRSKRRVALQNATPQSTGRSSRTAFTTSTDGARQTSGS